MLNALRPRRRLVAALATALIALAPVLPGTRSATAAPAAGGYWFVAADGGIFSYGDARFFGSTGDIALNKPIVGMAATPSGNGYWFVAADGGVFSFGDARFFGSTGDIALNKPIVGMAGTPSGNGYWFVASDGGIFSFGDADFYGSTGAIRLNKPIVGMAATPSGKGYWFVASDGGIFSYGDAKFYGSTAGVSVRSPIVAMAATPTGRGYWLAAADGSVYGFGDALFHGSMGGRALSLPIVGLTATPSGSGYWLVASDGGIFSYGDAPFYGSTGDIRLNKPIVGMSPAVKASSSSGGPGGSDSSTTTQPGTSPTTHPGTATTTGPTPTTTTPPTTAPPPGNAVDWGAADTTVRVVQAARGGGDAFRPWMSGDGRFLAFDSSADNIVPNDTNGIRDVFVYDRVGGTVERVNVGSGAAQATGPTGTGAIGSQRPTLSADGRYVAFWSDATNLVPGDTNGEPDAFVHDRHTGETRRVSVGPNGVQGNGRSARPVMSRDGRFVAFESEASNLVGGMCNLVAKNGDCNNAMDVFVHELATAVTTRVSVTSAGAEGQGASARPTISGDGRKVAFHSGANLAAGGGGVDHVYLRDLDAGTTTLVTTGPSGPADKGSASPSISANGRFISFDTRATNLGSSDNDGKDDIYVKDLQTGAVTHASVPDGGGRATGTTLGSRDSSISGDGRFVAFWSDATNMVPGDSNGFTDIFVRDLVAGTTRWVSKPPADSTEARHYGDSFSPALSVDGRFVAFDSKGVNADGTKNSSDVFVHVL